MESMLKGLVFFPFSDICYGFEVMEVRESPNTPFTILRTRFKEGVRFKAFLL